MENKFLNILNKVNINLIILNKQNEVIYNSNNFVLNLFKINQYKLNELYYEDKIYSVVYEDIDDYKIEIYNDITKYKQEIEKLQKDYLTNLYNRFAVTEKLEKLKDEKYIIVMCDIDHFKSINDSYGHLVGDYVLKEISNILLKNIDKNDIIGRYGGEEFIIVIPSKNVIETYNMIEKIRKIIENTKINVTYNDCVKEVYVSMTFGISSVNKNNNIFKLIGEADHALYFGKNNGRNQTYIYNKKDD